MLTLEFYTNQLDKVNLKLTFKVQLTRCHDLSFSPWLFQATITCIEIWPWITSYKPLVLDFPWHRFSISDKICMNLPNHLRQLLVLHLSLILYIYTGKLLITWFQNWMDLGSIERTWLNWPRQLDFFGKFVINQNPISQFSNRFDCEKKSP